MIPFNLACFNGNELGYLAQAISKGHVSGNGPLTRACEELLAGIHGTGQTLLTTSCTHALELSALLLNLEPGDEVIVPSFTFVSTASAFLIHGASLKFVDVRDDTLNLDPNLVVEAIGERTRAICLVHYAGIAAQPDVFAEICRANNLTLIEDNAHGFLGSYHGRRLGTFGQLSTLSFHETKNVTCGEGGALQINEPDLLDRAEVLREKGTDRSKFVRGLVDKYTWVDVGSSWVMSDLLAGVLLGQLEQVEAIQLQRASVWKSYQEGLAAWAISKGVKAPCVPDGCEHPSHLFYLRFPTGPDRTRFIDHMRNRGVSCVFHYQALNNSPVGARLGFEAGQCPVSELASDCLVRLPLHLGMSKSQVENVIDSALSFTV